MTLLDAVRLGSQTPTLLHEPSGAVSSAGQDVVELAASAGLILDEWQSDILDAALGERRGGKWAAFEVAVVVPRQNGKNALIEVRQLAGLFLFGERLQVHSAHEFKTALEHFLRIKFLIESTPDFDRRVRIIRTGSADMSVELLTGQRLRFVARSKSSGRGLTGDTVYLDEAFAVTPAQLGALVPTMRARPNPQLWYASSAPKHDSAFLHGLLKRGGGDDPRLFLAAWENPADTDPLDRDAWWRTNPAMGIRISEQAMADEHRLLSAVEEGMAEFMRECVGVREAPLSHSSRLELSAPVWLRARDEASEIDGPVVFAVDVAPDGVSSSIASAGLRDDGAGHVEVVESAGGTGWLEARLDGLLKAWETLAVGVDAGGPAQRVLPEIRRVCARHSVKLVELPARAYAAACGEFVGAVTGRLVWHRGQQWLDDAVGSGRRRPYGDAWVWDRRVGADVSPLVAVTVARRVASEMVGQVPAAADFQMI